MYFNLTILNMSREKLKWKNLQKKRKEETKVNIVTWKPMKQKGRQDI